MLEQDAGDAAELARVLSQYGVFELHHIDALRVDLAMDQPRQIRDAKFANRVGFDGAHSLRYLPAAGPDIRVDAQTASSSAWAGRSPAESSSTIR